MGIEKYSTTPGSNVNAATGVNFDEGQAPSTLNDSARQFQADVREWYENPAFPIYGKNGSANAYSISFVSATVFKFAGTDRRTLIPINRRVKAGVGAGTIYGTCSDVTLSASDTQVTVAWDSGTLDSSLSYVALGAMSSTNDAMPRNLDMSFSDVVIAGTLDVRGAASFSSIAGPAIAVQADMEAATSTTTLVTPGRQQFHPGMVKFRVKVNAAASISDSYNVTGVTDTGTGRLTVTIATDFSNASWNGFGNAESGGTRVVLIAPGTYAAGTVEFTCRDELTNLNDPTTWSVGGIGDQ